MPSEKGWFDNYLKEQFRTGGWKFRVRFYTEYHRLTVENAMYRLQEWVFKHIGIITLAEIGYILIAAGIAGFFVAWAVYKIIF